MLRMDARTDRQRVNSIPTTNKEGYNKISWLTTIPTTQAKEPMLEYTFILS